jgi:phosphate transport system protein
MMDNRFHQEQEQLRLIVLKMGALTERIVEKALRALFDRSLEMSAEVIQDDPEIDLLEMQIDRLVLKLLALGQPMAGDLRFIIGCMRIAVDLERVGDQAVSIAHRARYLTNRPPLPIIPAMQQLAETAVDMLRMAMDAFINHNVERATDVCHMDDKADRLNVQALQDLMDFMVNDTPAIQRAMQTIIVARCLERVADHATNIAETVCFVAEGVNIKHKFP